jgi:DMSO/TMAO reductase YedYZ molybdopterin-dependent catalytic subunit
MNRREMLKAIPAVAVAPMAASAADAPVAGDTPGLTVRMSMPENLESDFSQATTFITPTEQFFVRSHFAVPAIAESNFQLELTGQFDSPTRRSLADIKALPQVTKPITIECAGNGRVYLKPTAKGLQWQNGAVGTAEWTGPTLRTVLEAAKIKAAAKEVVLIGADKGVVADPPSPGAIAFSRSITVEKAMKDEVILAHSMNGQPLSPSHGFPLRAVVGGHYGMASVKWLTTILATDHPFDGFWQTLDYSYWEQHDGRIPSLKPITKMQPKSQIARPRFGEVITAGSVYIIRGAAWAGEAAVKSVRVSVNGGLNWQDAELIGEAVPFCWRHFRFSWTVPNTPGPATIRVKCIDDSGFGQPTERSAPLPTGRDADYRSYMIHHIIPVPVTIRGG